MALGVPILKHFWVVANWICNYVSNSTVFILQKNMYLFQKSPGSTIALAFLLSDCKSIKIYFKPNILKPRCLNPLKTGKLFWGRTLTVQTQLGRHRLRRLIRVYTVFFYRNSMQMQNKWKPPIETPKTGNDSSKYSRLSLSRSRRDPLKHFEISVLRHIRCAVLRKTKEQPNYTNEHVIWPL